jgi:hypothetical protein
MIPKSCRLFGPDYAVNKAAVARIEPLRNPGVMKVDLLDLAQNLTGAVAMIRE